MSDARRTIWAVSSGEYSSYRVHALYEDETDAHAVADHIGGFVEEFPLYSPGDRSYRRGTTWQAEIVVDRDGSLSTPTARTYDWYYVDSTGPLNTGDVRSRMPPERTEKYTVTGTGLTEKQAVKGAKDGAVQVAAAILEGLDPREIMWGRANENDVTIAHEDALIHEARLQQERERDAQERRQRALIAQWARRRVGLFDDDTQVGEWAEFGTGHIPLPAGFEGDPHRLQLRDEHGDIASPDLQVGQVLRLGKPSLDAVMWRRVPIVTVNGSDITIS